MFCKFQIRGHFTPSDSGGFDRITSTDGDPRILQMALKVGWQRYPNSRASSDLNGGAESAPRWSNRRISFQATSSGIASGR